MVLALPISGILHPVIVGLAHPPHALRTVTVAFVAPGCQVAGVTRWCAIN